jgi:hypothetical protein
MIGLALALLATSPVVPATTPADPPAAPAGWTPRQEQLIRLSNAITLADAFALMNSCKVMDGKARYAAAAGRVKALVPALEVELGSYPVYEIFVVHAPVINPAALPPARCKRLKRADPDRESIMARFETTVSALAAALEERL